jgi:hypothetical protein
VLLALGCGGPPGPLRRFLTDPAQRRELLLGSLWFRENDYARARLVHYGGGGRPDWTALPRFTPPSAPLPADGAAPSDGQLVPFDTTLPPPERDTPDEQELQQALARIGESAFFTYPAQLVSGFERIASSPERARRYGLWSGTNPSGQAQLGGLLRVRVPSGDRALAMSCSTCHAVPAADGRLVAGAANTELDLGLLASDVAGGADLPPARWGPGRLDTSHDGVDNPAAIPELRVVAAQRYLHHDATVRNDLFALALRIETLITTSLHEGAAPPVEVAPGLAVYLTLSTPAAAPVRPDDPGLAVFQAHCARCHQGSELAGEPVPLEVIGTDGTLGISRERGTGTYRTPTLRGVGLRRQLLHDGSLPDLQALLDPRRLDDSYTGGRHGAGRIAGHRYGLELPPSKRAALLAFLATR